MAFADLRSSTLKRPELAKDSSRRDAASQSASRKWVKNCSAFGVANERLLNRDVIEGAENTK